MSLKTTIEEYADWIAEDFTSAIKYVKPSLLQNVQEVKIVHKDEWEVPIFKQDKPYRKFPDDMEFRRLKWEFDNYYFYVKRMDTFKPWKNDVVGWSIYDSYNDFFDWDGVSRPDAVTIALLELGLHESLEWITITELGLPRLITNTNGDSTDWETYNEWLSNIPDDIPWPHDLDTYLGAYAKINDRWYSLAISF